MRQCLPKRFVADFIEFPDLWWSIRTVRELDLIDWTIQEAAEHLKTERREPSDPDGTTSLDKLLAVLEREPVEQANPEDPVAQIVNPPSIQLVAESPAEPASSEVVTPPEPDIILRAPTPLAPTMVLRARIGQHLVALLSAHGMPERQP